MEAMGMREKVKWRSFLPGMERLLSQGGFIAETVKSLFCMAYPKATFELAAKYADHGFWKVMELCDEFFADARNYAEECLDEDGDPVAVYDEDFMNWYAEQSVKCVIEQGMNKENHFWNDWNLSAGAKRAVRRFSVLEEKILFLREGLDHGKRREAAEIARLPELDCEEEYIKKILDGIEMKFTTTRAGKDGFDKECEKHRNEVLNEEPDANASDSDN